MLAVYRTNDFSSDAGGMLIDSTDDEDACTGTTRSTRSLSYAAPSADLHDLRSRVVRAMLPLRVDVETTREVRELVIAIFDRTFAITSALRVIAVAIAVSASSALFALVLERAPRDRRAALPGLSTGGVRSMVLCEAGLIGTLGGALASSTGLVLRRLVFVIDRQTFGWLIAWNVPVGAWCGCLRSRLVVAALAAGLYPGRRGGADSDRRDGWHLMIARIAVRFWAFAVAGAPFTRSVSARPRGPHAYENECGCVQGHLRAADGRGFGYELTYLRIGLGPGRGRRCPGKPGWRGTQLFTADFAIADMATSISGSRERSTARRSAWAAAASDRLGGPRRFVVPSRRARARRARLGAHALRAVRGGNAIA